MALSMRVLSGAQPLGHDLRHAIISIAFDSSYPTTGEPASKLKAQLGLKKIYKVNVDQPAGYVINYNYALDQFVVYRQKDPANAGGADIALPEVTASVDLSALTDVRVEIWGY